MFSHEDIRQLVAHFPPEHSSTSQAPRFAIAQPFVIPSISSDGLLRSDIVRRNIVHILETELSRWVQTLVFAQKLGVDTNALLELCEQTQDSVLLSRDKAAIASKRHRDDLKSELLKTAASSIVPVEDFALASDTNASDILLFVSEFNKTTGWEDQLVVIAGSGADGQSERSYVCQRRLLKNVEDRLLGQVTKASKDAEPLVCNPTDFGGTGSISLLRTLMQNLGVNAQSKLRDRLESHGSILVYKPESYLVKQNDLILDRLRNGDLPFVHCTQFTNNSGEPCSWTDAVKLVTDRLSDIPILCSDYLVSMAWLGRVADMKTNELASNGYTKLDLGEETSVLSKEEREELAQTVKRKIQANLTQAVGHSQVEFTRGYFVTADVRKRFEEYATDQARQQARTQWDSNSRAESPDYTMTDIDPFSNSFLDPRLAEILLQTGPQDRARVEFAKEIVRVENANEEQFAHFWQERVVVRLQLYEMAVESLEADKLQSQLLEVLHDHVVKELIPENLARARAKGLVRSRKTGQNVEKLEAALAAIAKPGPSEDHALRDLKLVLGKFMRKQKIEWFDADSLSGKKLAHVEDMVKSIQKENDGAKLFLVLVIVLLSKTQEGVLYATGRFAPRLLRALKGTLDTKRYQRLEQLKDSVKAGNATEEDREAMRTMAA